MILALELLRNSLKITINTLVAMNVKWNKCNCFDIHGKIFDARALGVQLISPWYVPFGRLSLNNQISSWSAV